MRLWPLQLGDGGCAEVIAARTGQHPSNRPDAGPEQHTSIRPGCATEHRLQILHPPKPKRVRQSTRLAKCRRLATAVVQIAVTLPSCQHPHPAWKGWWPLICRIQSGALQS